MAKNTPSFVLRPFEGLPGEPDWVALRELVPAATATARTTAEHGARDVVVTTVLPNSWAALHRADGVVLVALQTGTSSGDASRDVATALLLALDAEPGTAIENIGLPTAGPRLQDVLDLSVPFEVTVQESFSYWLDPSTEVTPDLQAAMEEADAGIVDTRRLTSVESAYWCRMGAREYLRWAQPADEQVVLDGLARLHARRESGFDDGKFIGYFRAAGIVVPVWELARGSEAEDVEKPVADFAPRLEAAMADTTPLDANARRARAGLVARQVTLR
ncbi:topoisomerase II [Cellulomonas sp. zg-ZUI222]|uniref:Topoisomerase II n=1 Tax=Cellulomonas wangleii TaxID=2816956 RepID=A0ABX8D3F8_9CELL|nr:MULTISPECIES: DUF5926 family protein [Cellulomonas]MBO0899045.1 topoisomerase II [Cellulomonas sp. zg-ZUI22]MBO0919898.1 topoisomerase II [Cellulomonas wangleii]MBO0923673.1 topoisomerase II [Cellulomonas wangleii]QVI61988.1 topoisomerase II [Cellulomonas wangleii]